MKIFVQVRGFLFLFLFLFLIILAGNTSANPETTTNSVKSTAQNMQSASSSENSNAQTAVDNANVSAGENTDVTDVSDADKENTSLNNSAKNNIDAEDKSPTLSHDLSVWGMYQGADIVVKAVMIGLILASIITWTIALAKGLELFIARRKLRKELNELKQAKTLKEASKNTDHKGELSHLLVFEAITELALSISNLVKDGVKERVSFRLSRLVGNCGRNMARGTGILATIGAVAPFVGLFGTVWGIMNSFIGIAKSQTTNLAVVAPGIAEALLATALGLVAAIPAVIIYNVFARIIASYKAQVNDCASEVLLLLSRDLDRDINTVINEISSEINHRHEG